VTTISPALLATAVTTPPADHPVAAAGFAVRSFTHAARPGALLAGFACVVARFSGDYAVTVVTGHVAVSVDLTDNPTFGEAERRVNATSVQPVDVTPALHVRIAADRVVEVRFRADWFSAELMERFVAAFRILLDRVAADPDVRVQDLPLPGRPQVVREATRRQPRQLYPRVTQLVARVVAADPAATAVVEGDRRWSYGALDSLSAEVAETLRAVGHRTGETVGICPAERCFELYAGMLGVWRAEGVLAMIEAAPSADRLAAMLDRARAHTVLVIATEPPAWWPEIPVGNVLLLTPGRGISVLREGRDRGVAFTEDSAAYLFFTSGTTGPPKALVGRHDSLSHFLLWQRDKFGIGPGDRCAQLTSLFTDGVLRDIFTPLISGATLHVPPGPGVRTDDPEIFGWLARSGVTVAHTMPSLSGHWLAGAEGRPRLERLRQLFFSGEPLTGALTGQWHALAPRAELVNLYGTSECTMVQAFHRVSRNRAELVQPAGAAMPGAQLLVLTPSGALCGPGEVGRVHIRTPYAALGYLDRERSVFTRNPFRPDDPADRVFRTEDRARVRPDGLIEVLGREPEGTTIGGARVEPARVNAMLAREPGVRASAVLRDPGSSGLIAFVVPSDPSVRIDDVHRALRRKLPPEAVPAHLVPVPSLPVTAVGKLDRDHLRTRIEKS
jgi:amino acid adenylation domain-containing protein